MIKYQLNCQSGHEFEAWFHSIAGYDEQKQKGYVVCPFCGTHNVEKAIMAPAIKRATPKPNEAIAATNTPEFADNLVPEPVREFMKGWREQIEKNYDYVGDKFASEARAIHEGETDPRPIFGETTPKEARELIEEGIKIAPIPPLANPKGDKGVN